MSEDFLESKKSQILVTVDEIISFQSGPMSPESIVKAAAAILGKAALDLFQVDQHNFSTRPCGTCQAISKIIGEPWGCIAYAIQKRKGEPNAQ